MHFWLTEHLDWCNCPLKRIPASGGPETVVLDRVIADTWSVTSQGIYFLTREAGSLRDSGKTHVKGPSPYWRWRAFSRCSEPRARREV